MKAHEVRTMSNEELENELESLKENLFNQKARGILGQLEDTTLLSKIRKDIARIKTIQRARELETQDE
ncbi:50S ribosomal protein L29 [Candidatus Poribacteria bacterium]|nr:MAG: 50S ribosomal protein L29 [Candidatus Poribacteria bacterium]